MPVLINIDSGLPEELGHPDDVSSALKAGSHEVPLISPEGEHGSASLEDARTLIKQGYSQPTPDHLSKMVKEAKYKGTGEQVIAGLEQVAKGVAGPLATGAELALGVPEEDITGREESLSTAQKMLGQGIGLVGSAFIPGGQAKALTAIGEIGAHALGVGEAASIAGKIGSAAAKAAIENAVFQAGDEVSRVMLHDPNQTAGSALANIGLAGVIGGATGGAFGAVNPLWSVTMGNKAENFLRTIANRANGESVPISKDLLSVISELKAQGKPVPPELIAGLSDNPIASNHYQQLIESGTSAGEALKETLGKFKDDTAEQMASVFKTQEPMTAFEAGEKAKNGFIEKANKLNEGISEKYGAVTPHLDAIQVPDTERLKFYDGMIEAGQNFGAKGSTAEGMFKNYGERALAQDTIGQLKKLNTEIGSDWSVARRAGDFEKARALQQIRDSIKEFQDSQIVKSGARLEAEGIPGAVEMSKNLVQDKKVADKMYAQFIETVGEISGAGKLGKVKSHGQLLEALDKVPAAKLADKLFDPKNVEGLRYLKENFPEVFEPLVQAKKTALLEAASKTGDLKHTTLLNATNSIPKEVRALMFTPKEESLLNASGRILRESNVRKNPSGTAGTLDKMREYMPASVGGMASAVLGHSPMLGALAGHAAKFLGRDVPDAVKLSLLKFLGSAEPISGTAWKAAVDYTQAALKGELLVQKASKAVLKAGQEVLPKAFIPDDKSREKLKKRLDEVRVDNSHLFKVGGHIGHYMPDHSTALASTSMNAVNYLNSLKPVVEKTSPLDSDLKPNQMQIAEYNRALDIAEQPLIVLEAVKDGTITPTDLKHLNATNPTIYKRLTQTLGQQIVDMKASDEPIPYRTRMGLSLFLGRPLDSTMLPSSIQAAQPPPQMPMAQQGAPQGNKGSMKNINKLALGQASGSQNREMQKAGTAKT